MKKFYLDKAFAYIKVVVISEFIFSIKNKIIYLLQGEY
jgi:hypothetical protein